MKAQTPVSVLTEGNTTELSGSRADEALGRLLLGVEAGLGSPSNLSKGFNGGADMMLGWISKVLGSAEINGLTFVPNRRCYPELVCRK